MKLGFDVTVGLKKRQTSKIGLNKSRELLKSPTSSDPTSVDGDVNARVTQTLAAWPVGGELLSRVQEGGNMT